MKVQHTTLFDLKAYIQSRPPTERADQPTMVSGKLDLSHNTDTVEISTASRQLASSDVVNHAARYFGTVQINESLERSLQDQSPEVREAVYGIIQSNFITDVTEEDQRSALLELGLAQAKYIADNYMKGDQAAAFMDTIRQIGAISTTRTINPETKQIQYATPPQKPVGAPEDYVDLNYMMRKFQPDTFNKLQDAIVNGKDWSRILTDFAKKASTNQEWLKEYREAATQPSGSLPARNRFEHADTTRLSSFASTVQDIIAQLNSTNNTFLTDNLQAFIRKLGSQ
ncbi:hypothetical protein HUB98_16635 [Paenibacillus barcinonensis]|uniref:Uncharacterized protein n=1 Tax=Paenibacillus barcinonensis TaxID=198119 RepID=A0A2V4W2U6_PAEBA|nr:hypothetical protein [Paenibacillus barcinonensis]PYE48810.1 hypothetical protein DFQ00_107103 [Paenibacillus barcinonensis]QKS57763.1 hypothetical protein HUB98_16635 [Paenibacillus barcinonensis]